MELKHVVEKRAQYFKKERIHMALTLSLLGFFMYVKQLGWGKITPPEQLLNKKCYRAEIWHKYIPL